MVQKISILILLILFPVTISGQTETDFNKTDNTGKKQGRWIKKNPEGNILYDGYFKDDKPVGEFKRYYPDNTLKSVLIFSSNSLSAEATNYYPNGFVASKGKYINQMKEGKWLFYSIITKDLKISEEEYSSDKRNGLSIRFYPDSTVAETIHFKNDKRDGEWIMFHPNGQISFRTTCVDGKINGKFEAFFDDGKPEITGLYKNDLRDGSWVIYSKEGRKRFTIGYINGMAQNKDLDIFETNYIDSIEINRVKISDPEKTGIIW